VFWLLAALAWSEVFVLLADDSAVDDGGGSVCCLMGGGPPPARSPGSGRLLIALAVLAALALCGGLVALVRRWRWCAAASGSDSTVAHHGVRQCGVHLPEHPGAPPTPAPHPPEHRFAAGPGADVHRALGVQLHSHLLAGRPGPLQHGWQHLGGASRQSAIGITSWARWARSPAWPSGPTASRNPVPPVQGPAGQLLHLDHPVHPGQPAQLLASTSAFSRRCAAGVACW